jgi:hypothetical protein
MNMLTKPQSFADLYREGVPKEELMAKFALTEHNYERIIACLKELGTI